MAVMSITVWCRCYNAVNSLKNIFKIHPHSSPARAKYGLCFVVSAPDWYSASIPAMMFAISCYTCIGLRYNDTQEYIEWWCWHLLWNCSQVNGTELRQWEVNIGSGNGLVPSGTKPLPEPMLTQIYVAIWCHYRPQWVNSCYAELIWKT